MTPTTDRTDEAARYCLTRGIPLSEFDRWDPADRAAALAWQDHRDRERAAQGSFILTVVALAFAGLAIGSWIDGDGWGLIGGFALAAVVFGVASVRFRREAMGRSR